MHAAPAVRRALQDALALVLPVSCAGCGVDDVALCEDCDRALTPRVVARSIDGVRVWSGLEFDAIAARVIRSFKEEGRTGLARALAPPLAAAVAAASSVAGSTTVQDAVLVPVPTSRASFRRRGFHVAELIARRAGVPIVRMLGPVRASVDQRGLGKDERRRNVRGSLAVRGAIAGTSAVRGRRVLVLDDVVTTGATIAEAVRALRAGGADVVGAVTVAATPRRHDAKETRR